MRSNKANRQHWSTRWGANAPLPELPCLQGEISTSDKHCTATCCWVMIAQDAHDFDQLPLQHCLNLHICHPLLLHIGIVLAAFAHRSRACIDMLAFLELLVVLYLAGNAAAAMLRRKSRSSSKAVCEEKTSALPPLFVYCRIHVHTDIQKAHMKTTACIEGA